MLKTASHAFPSDFRTRRPEPDGPSDDERSQSHAGNITIAKLPDEILLWIFDFYRQTFEPYCCPERVWNSNRGWFKLAHVCRNWRCIVLSSSSRLRLRIYFTVIAPTRAAMLTRPPLASLPIVVDYFRLDRTARPPERLVSAMSYPNRVCRIVVAVRGAISFDRIFKALDSYFPALESLEICDKRIYDSEVNLPLPPTFLKTSTKSLRRLELRYVILASLPPLLSAATALVDLTLSVDKIICLQSDVSLLVLLQYLPRLRHLDLSITHFSVSPIRAIPGNMNDMVSLPQLSDFRVQGGPIPVEQLVARLATPSLQELHISVYPCDGLNDFPRPHLFRFIRDAGMRFRAARVTLSPPHHLLSLCTHSQVIDDPTYSVIALRFMAIIDGALSDMLAAVEDVFLDLSRSFLRTQSFRVDLAPCRGFFEQLQNVKILRIQHGLETEVVNIFRQGYTGSLQRISSPQKKRPIWMRQYRQTCQSTWANSIWTSFPR
jgi:F-box-like